MDIVVRDLSRMKVVDRRGVGTLVSDLARAMGVDRDCAVIFVDDRRMRELNRRFRNLDRTTDVLSFASEGQEMLGDILISLPRAFAQARAVRRSPETETRWLIVHGFLHLIGFDHETDRGKMRRRERRLMAELAPRRLLRLESVAVKP